MVSGTLSGFNVGIGAADRPGGEVAKLIGPVTELGDTSGEGTDSEESDTDVGPSDTENALSC